MVKSDLPIFGYIWEFDNPFSNIQPIATVIYLKINYKCNQLLIIMSMSMGSFAAYKVRDNMSGAGNYTTTGQSSCGKSSTDMYSNTIPSLNKYNDKKMMGVWGDYNRYSVHNLKGQKEKA